MTEITLDAAVPVPRIYDVAKAREFYVDFLGFKVDWEHWFDDNAPLYMQVSRSGARLHLSEHYGDGTPGTVSISATRTSRRCRRSSTPRVRGSRGRARRMRRRS